VSCPGLHCPGCGHGGGLAALGVIAAAALAAAAAWEIISALVVIVVIVAAAGAIAVAAAVVIARHQAPPASIGPVRVRAAITADPSRRELEDRLQRAEIDASAAMLAVSILAQQPRPLPLSVSYSDTERAIPR
jgi:hypothetical protein